MNYLTKKEEEKINNLKKIRFYIGDLVSKLDTNNETYRKISRLTASIMGPVDIFVKIDEEILPVYYYLLDGGTEKVKLSDSLDNYIKIIELLYNYSDFLLLKDPSFSDQNKYGDLIKKIKSIDNNVEFWESVIF